MAIRLRKKPPKKEEIVEESAGFKQKREEEELKQKIVELGLEKKVIELPPDEVSEKDVERDAATSILAMIPYTNAWWEAKAAEEELDGLKRIREEIGRANALVTMTRVGKHEEALAEMMDETNNDFHYFNKLKTKETELGRYHYVQKNLNIFADTLGQNRIKKAMKMQFDIVDTNLLKPIKSRKYGAGKFDSKELKCPWR